MIGGAIFLVACVGVPIILERLVPERIVDKLLHILRFEEGGKW